MGEFFHNTSLWPNFLLSNFANSAWKTPFGLSQKPPSSDFASSVSIAARAEEV